jgi:hypothetical protein
MALTLRPTGLASPAHADRQDWTVYEDGKPIGRIYWDSSAHPGHGVLFNAGQSRSRGCTFQPEGPTGIRRSGA